MYKLLPILLFAVVCSNEQHSGEERVKDNVSMKQAESIHPADPLLYTFSAKDSLYINKRKSHIFAGTLAFFSNYLGLGHAYVGKWGRSIPFTIGMFLGMKLIVSGLSVDRDENIYFNKYSDYGMMLALGSIFGAVYDASSIAKKFNYELYKSIYNEEIPKGFDKELSKKMLTHQKQKY